MTEEQVIDVETRVLQEAKQEEVDAIEAKIEDGNLSEAQQLLRKTLGEDKISDEEATALVDFWSKQAMNARFKAQQQQQ